MFTECLLCASTKSCLLHEFLIQSSPKKKKKIEASIISGHILVRKLKQHAKDEGTSLVLISSEYWSLVPNKGSPRPGRSERQMGSVRRV